MWVISLVNTDVGVDTVLQKIGTMKRFSSDVLGFTEEFREKKVVGGISNFTGNPFSAQLVTDSVRANKKYRVRMGMKPRKWVNKSLCHEITYSSSAGVQNQHRGRTIILLFWIHFMSAIQHCILTMMTNIFLPIRPQS